MSSPTILVKIASYRDPELPKTIRSAIENAAHSDNLRFAIHNQDELKGNDDLKQWRKDPRFKITDVHWRDAAGVGNARAINDSKWDGEDFIFQIDSHIRFGRNWDLRLLSDWSQHYNPNAVLSTYPHAYEYRNGKEVFDTSPYIPRRVVIQGIVEDTVTVTDLYDQPVKTDRPHLLIAAGFVFARGIVSEDVPNYANINYGEELMYSLQLFRKGYHVYTPKDSPIWHWYGDRGGTRKTPGMNVVQTTREACNKVFFEPDSGQTKRPTRVFMKKLKLAYFLPDWPEDWPDPNNWDKEVNLVSV